MPRPTTLLVAALSATALGLPLAACGSSSSKDQPAYCADRTKLTDSITALKDVNPKDGVAGIKAQLQQVSANAQAVVDSAKGDFPSETGQIQSSVDALKTTVDNTASSPSASDIVTLGANISSVVSSIKAFTKATDASC